MVRTTRDRVPSACKSELTDAGFMIPWPIRTLATDRRPLQVEPSATDRLHQRA